jgi:hypothetical protein
MRLYERTCDACGDAGLYVLLSCGENFGLAVLGEDTDGNLCATSAIVTVAAADFCLFHAVGIASTRYERRTCRG